jgi:polyhydroxybutyrate depolymerase
MRLIRRTLAPLAGLAALFALGCSQESTLITNPPTGSPFNRSVESGGRTRTYQIFVPSTVRSDVPAPILIALHGSPGTGSDMRGITGFDQVADLLQTIMVYPDATSDWAEGCDCATADGAGVDDVQFVRDMIDDLDSAFAVDRTRIYAAGFSQGGMFAMRLACEMNEISAVGIVAATMSVPLAEGCAPGGPVPLALIHGTLDATYPAGGRAAGAPLLGARPALQFWLDNNGCQATPTQTSTQDGANDGTSVEVELYQTCDGSSEVEFYEVINGGHTWPNPAIVFPPSSGLKTNDIDAAAVLGVFFLRH